MLATSIPSGDAGTRATLQTMAGLARADALHPRVRALTVQLVRGLTRPSLQARIIGEWIAQHVRFLPDPTVAETLWAPSLVLQQIGQQGVVYVDCDDVAMLAASMGLSIGLSARLVAVAFGSPKSPFQHVWTDLGPRDWSWVRSVDPTRSTQGLASAPISRGLMLEL